LPMWEWRGCLGFWDLGLPLWFVSLLRRVERSATSVTLYVALALVVAW
jgi:hypothetical protein